MSLTNTLKRAVLSFSLVYSLALPTKALAAIYSFSPTYTAPNRAFSFGLLSNQFGSCTTYSGLISLIKADTISLSFTPTTPIGCTNLNSQSYYGPTFTIQGLQAGLYKVRAHILDKVVCLACPPGPGDDAGTFLVADSVKSAKKVGWFLKETTITMGKDPYPIQLLNHYFENGLVGFLNTSVFIQNGGIYTSFRVMRYPSGITPMVFLPGPTFNLTPPLLPGAYPVYATELMDCEVATVGPVCVVDRLPPVAVDTLFVMATTEILVPGKNSALTGAGAAPTAHFQYGRLNVRLPQAASPMDGHPSASSTGIHSSLAWQAELLSASGRILKAYRFEGHAGETVSLDQGRATVRGVYLLRLRSTLHKTFILPLVLNNQSR